MSSFPYLAGVSIDCKRFVKPIKIDFVPSDSAEFRNLVLTGSNGAGKTSILQGIHNEIAYFLNNNSRSQNDQIKKYQHNISVWSEQLKNTGLNMEQRHQLEKNIKDHNEAIETLLNNPIAELGYTKSDHNFRTMFADKKYMYCYLSAQRTSNVEPVKGPSNDQLKNAHSRQTESLSKYFLQFLVNKRTEQAYAREDKEYDVADGIEKWFESILDVFRSIFSDPKLELKFKRKTFSFEFHLGNSKIVNFNQLSDGFSGALAILSELFIRWDYLLNLDSSFQGNGLVLIDEVETHLHMELQRSLMPLLQRLFPKVQFIIATHSPTVISSIDNAVVFDLTKQSQIETPLGAIPFNVLAKEHFGLSSEFSISITKKLSRAKDLISKGSRSSQEQAELSSLASELERMSPSLANEIQLAIERQNRG